MVHLKEVQAVHNSVTLRETQCSGAMCDKQDIRDDGRCGCVTMVRTRRATVAFQMKIMLVVNPDDENNKMTIPIDEFSSQNWMEMFLADNLDQTTRIDKNDYFVLESIDDRMKEVFRMIPRWNAVMWVKRAMVEDKDSKVENPNPYNRDPVPKTMVKSSNLIYHLVSLLPSEPEAVNLAALNRDKLEL